MLKKQQSVTDPRRPATARGKLSEGVAQEIVSPKNVNRGSARFDRKGYRGGSVLNLFTSKDKEKDKETLSTTSFPGVRQHVVEINKDVITNSPKDKGTFPGIRQHALVDDSGASDLDLGESEGGESSDASRRKRGSMKVVAGMFTPRKQKSMAAGLAVMSKNSTKSPKPRTAVRKKGQFEGTSDGNESRVEEAPQETEEERERRREEQFQKFMAEEEPADNPDEEQAEDMIEDEDDVVVDALLRETCERLPFSGLSLFSFSTGASVSFGEDGYVDAPRCLVIDNGSSYLRAGLNIPLSQCVAANEKYRPSSGEEDAVHDYAPTFAIANTVNCTNSVNEDNLLLDYMQGERKTGFIDSKSRARKKLVDMFHPIQKGIVTHWDHMQHVWEVMYEEMGMPSDEQPVILSESPLNDSKCRDRAAEIFFETFNVPGLYTAPDSKLKGICSNRSTALVVDVGQENTRIVPIYGGSVMQGGVQLVDVGAEQVTDYLHLLISQMDSSAHTAPVSIFAQLARERCYVPLDPAAEFQRISEFGRPRQCNLFPLAGANLLLLLLSTTYRFFVSLPTASSFHYLPLLPSTSYRFLFPPPYRSSFLYQPLFLSHYLPLLLLHLCSPLLPIYVSVCLFPHFRCTLPSSDFFFSHIHSGQSYRYLQSALSGTRGHLQA